MLLLFLFVTFILQQATYLFAKYNSNQQIDYFFFLNSEIIAKNLLLMSRINFVSHKTTYSPTSYSFPIGKYSSKPENSSNRRYQHRVRSSFQFRGADYSKPDEVIASNRFEGQFSFAFSPLVHRFFHRGEDKAADSEGLFN